MEAWSMRISGIVSLVVVWRTVPVTARYMKEFVECFSLHYCFDIRQL